MPYDGCVLYHTKKELEPSIINSKIERIYQPEQYTLILELRSKGENHRLLISAHPNSARFHLTNIQLENPITPPSFCMVLRKHLIGGRIVELSQTDLDRILNIRIEILDELGHLKYRTLIVEIMGRHSNIILTDSESQRIFDSIKRVPESISRYRQIIPGYVYKSPPYQGKLIPFSDNKDLFSKLLKSSPASKISNIIVKNYMGISPALAKHIVESSGLGNKSKQDVITKENIVTLWNSFKDTMEQIQNNNVQPTVFIDNESNKPIDFHLLPLKQYNYLINLKKDDINSAIDLYYTRKINIEETLNYKNNLEKVLNSALERCNRKLDEYMKGIRDADNKENYRIYGELITANIYRIEKGATEIQVKNYYQEELPEILIELDPSLTPSQNAQAHFKKYRKLKNTEKILNKMFVDVKKERDYLEGIMVNLENTNEVSVLDDIKQELINQGYIKSKRKQKIESRKKSEKEGIPERFISSTGFEILVGKNNKQNDYLSLRLANNNDIWFHTKDIPGSHVIIRTMGRKPDETTILEAACLAAFYSKAKNSSNVPVDYTEKKHLRKPKGAKPGMVIYENHNTVYVTPSQVKVNKLKDY